MRVYVFILFYLFSISLKAQANNLPHVVNEKQPLKVAEDKFNKLNNQKNIKIKLNIEKEKKRKFAVYGSGQVTEIIDSAKIVKPDDAQDILIELTLKQKRKKDVVLKAKGKLPGEIMQEIVVKDEPDLISNQREITLEFDGNGHLSEIGNEEELINEGEMVKIKVKIKKDLPFLKEQFKPLFDRYRVAYNNLDKGENTETLNKYQITATDLELIKNDFLAKMYQINLICGYVKNLKQIIPKFNSLKIAAEIENNDGIFTNLYTFNFDGIRSEKITQGDSIEINNVLPNCIKNYELRFEKPMACVVNSIYVNAINVMPNDISILQAIADKDLFKKELDEAIKIRAKLDSAKYDGKQDSLCKKLREKISIIIARQDFIDRFMKSSSAWTKTWLWYTEGVPTLDPFMVKHESTVKNRKEIIRLRNDLATNLKRLQYLDSIVIKVPFKPDESKLVFLFADSITNTTKRIQLINAEIERLIGLNTAIEKSSEAEDLTINEIEDILLYKGKFALGQHNHRSIVEYRNHDAENKFIPFYSFSKNYDENVDVIILAENETLPIQIKVTDNAIKESTITGRNVGPSIDVLEGVLKSAEETCDVDLEPLVKYYNFMNTTLIPISDFNLFQKSASTPIRQTFLSITNKSDTSRTSFTRTYQLKAGKDSALFSYTVNKLYRFWPAAGFVYSHAKNPEVKINADGSLSPTYFNGMHAMAGLKIHFFKTAIMDPYFIWSNKRYPRFDYRKSYAFIGTDVQYPTKQFYVGIGIDLWSGLSLAGGIHMIRENQQKYNYGVIQSKEYLDWKNFYCGINLDITLAVKVIQFIFK
jgi:hypothetical protein